jgi:hypothetical protein
MLTRPIRPHDLTYVHSDIPDGMTIGEWRTRRAAERLAADTAPRKDGRRRRARSWLSGYRHVRP